MKNCRCEQNRLQEVSKDLSHAVEIHDEVREKIKWVLHARNRSATQNDLRAKSTASERDPVCAEEWMSVESIEAGMVKYYHKKQHVRWCVVERTISWQNDTPSLQIR